MLRVGEGFLEEGAERTMDDRPLSLSTTFVEGSGLVDVLSGDLLGRRSNRRKSIPERDGLTGWDVVKVAGGAAGNLM